MVVDHETKELRFEAQQGFDVAAKLEELSEEVKYFKGFELQDN